MKISKFGLFLSLVYIIAFVLTIVSDSYISLILTLPLVTLGIPPIISAIILIPIIYLIGHALSKAWTPGSFKLQK